MIPLSYGLIRPTKSRYITTYTVISTFVCAKHSPQSHLSKVSFKRQISTSTTTTSIKSSFPARSVNPPSSTRPPPLTLPDRTNYRSALSYYFSLGRAYLAFYKTGLKSVFLNYTLSRKLLTSLPPATSLSSALRHRLLTRAEFQLVRRSRADVRKILPFGLVLLICGEFTPLVVLALGAAVVPSVCMVPTQVQKEREKLETRRKKSFREVTVRAESETREATPGNLGRGQVLHAGRSLGLYPAWTDRFGGYPTDVVMGRLERYMEYLQADDEGLEREGDFERLDAEEVRIALEERGVDVLGKPEEILREQLRAWLRAKDREPLIIMLLMRPNKWATKG